MGGRRIAVLRGDGDRLLEFALRQRTCPAELLLQMAVDKNDCTGNEEERIHGDGENVVGCSDRVAPPPQGRRVPGSRRSEHLAHQQRCSLQPVQKGGARRVSRQYGTVCRDKEDEDCCKYLCKGLRGAREAAGDGLEEAVRSDGWVEEVW